MECVVRQQTQHAVILKEPERLKDLRKRKGASLQPEVPRCKLHGMTCSRRLSTHYELRTGFQHHHIPRHRLLPFVPHDHWLKRPLLKAEDPRDVLKVRFRM